MINHVRTLLLNISADRNTGAGAEFIDPAFRPQALLPWMADVRNVLFPAGFDAAQQNCRAAALLPILHQPELLPYLQLFDPRVTYALATTYYQDMAALPTTTEASQLLGKLEGLDARVSVASQLFSTWDTYADELAALRVIWYQSAEAMQRLGAFILGLVIQMERLRQGVPMATQITTVTKVI